MAQRWMQAKTTKMKRDGIRDTRGCFERFKDNPSQHVARDPAPEGWMVLLSGERFQRGLPRTYGPFATEDEARAFAKRSRCDAAIKPVGKAAPRPTPTGKIPDGRGLDYLVAEHTAHLAAAKEQSRSRREALGKRTSFPWSRA